MWNSDITEEEKLLQNIDVAKINADHLWKKIYNIQLEAQHVQQVAQERQDSLSAQLAKTTKELEDVKNKFKVLQADYDELLDKWQTAEALFTGKRRKVASSATVISEDNASEASHDVTEIKENHYLP